MLAIELPITNFSLLAILMQNDDFGRDYVSGFKKGLGDKASTMIVSSLPLTSSTSV